MEQITRQQVAEIVNKQREYFKKGETLDVNFRIKQLNKLKQMVVNNEARMIEALKADLGRHLVEAYFCDVGSVVLEINETLKGLRRWARPKTLFSGLHCAPSIITKVYRMPFGNTLIMSPFNFPFLLALGPLIPAIAGGNTAVIKASHKSANCTALLKELISETFAEEYITVIDGDHDVADYCLEERFDKIFYTGSPRVAVHVMEMAAKNLTPVTLELGGENGNWCIVRKDADIKDAARKIAFFKACNSGQICINLNHVAVAREVADEFIRELKKAFERTVGVDPVNSDEYPKLISPEAYDKCAAEADEFRSRIVYGGFGNKEKQKYAPTIIYPVNTDESLVNHELFCPIIPIIPFDDDKVDEIIDVMASKEHGLALYIFTRNKKWANKIFRTQQYGGGCYNEVILFLMVKGAPFNGTGRSGMGTYHGKFGFEEFSHPSTVLYGLRHFNLNMREHPYEGKTYKYKLLKFFER
ncbi:MAG: aldehyde dehydrogenase family protein [Lachnospiraceae bacterium]|nr:aldehyde dehydrogenase family protein [Lachnospiraceae bacterium]